MNDRVLVIDDSLPMHQLLNAHMSDSGVECISAYDGERGVKMAAAEHPALILLDVDLPNADGFEVCAQLRANTQTARIPIMFLTADFNTADKIRGLELGAVDYITKPCNFSELTARVKAAMHTRQLADAQAMRDSLTGMWSKAYLGHQLAPRIAAARHAGEPLSCIVADIDDLGRINERYGRGVGDAVICTVARNLTDRCAADELACVIRGGTFAILIGLDRRDAARRAKRHADHLQREIASQHNFDFAVTCSFGVADAAVARDDTLLERAEAAMRRAKANGAASVSVARPDRNLSAR
jgi:two-component system, cell cycle response regulator